MALELLGKLVEINPTEQMSERFKKRTFALDITESGSEYKNYAKLQAVQSRCELLDNFKVGDDVKVCFNVRGNRWEKDGKVNYITTLDAWKINKVDAQQQAPQQGYSQGSSQEVPF